MIRPTPTGIYIGDNGATLCGSHLGMTARYTGRDVSGQELLELTAPIVQALIREGQAVPGCEVCGRTPSALVLA